MARRLPTTTLRLFSRRLNTASSSSSIAAGSRPSKPEPAAPTIVDLDDHRKLFSSVSTWKLLRSTVNLGLVANEMFVDFGMWVMNSRLVETGLVRDVILKTVKHTMFEHFCAGETTEEAGKCVRKMHEAGLRGMLSYAVEQTSNNDGCDRNLEGFIRSVDLSKSLPPSSVSFVIAKITAICPINLLRRVSDLLRWQYKDPSFTLPWKLNTLPIFTDISPLYHTLRKPEPLTPQEEQDLELAHKRLQDLCRKCVDLNVPLTIDAEDTSLQPAIDYFTYSSAIMYNKDGNATVYGTIQAYLKDAKERLFTASKTADKLGVPMGFKMVRGAYMSSENRAVSRFGYDSPIHDSIDETHSCYDECASFMLERIANGNDAVVLATHNLQSGKLAASKARDLGIRKGNPKLEFAQLYGMSEALSFGLRNAGFQVSKYLPYGPVDMVMPYLLRRTEENRGLLSTSSIDRVLIR
ncbi:Proline dehydrogenase 1 [Hibiscus syriacus]|uniref:Proline dehydrogenase n=1 Tax=Hibiscus syriacus TaxID=106335 RepID=A0A6A2X9Z6_HIBSY|nr:proline dehydrogenase 2, mitochondrial-like [Hibiscus syriacus]KAE8672122.1 Proline dehydrogenase 1 [Hibiscus syriacus]